MTALLSMLDRFEQAAVTYETSTAKADRDELHAARRAIMEEHDALRKYAHEATKAITSLTVGGSEFFGRKIGDMYTADLPFCVEHIKDRETRTYKRLLRVVTELNDLKAARAAIHPSLEQELAK